MFDLLGFFDLWHIDLGLFNAKVNLVEGQLWYYLTNSWNDKGAHTFPKGTIPKVNLIAWLEFEKLWL